ncbi:sensor histidine kinase [Sinosporangium siamense]|uniref:sensor histidine kinase n=1 Tax=Sinosporangium siamense TaxID=1367973 RepID=UPI00194E8D27|nr:ATP-binding protein [Sinosporangium siamense]
MNPRQILGLVAVALGGVAGSAVAGASAMLPACVVVGVLVWVASGGSGARRHLMWLTGLAAAVSLAVTVAYRLGIAVPVRGAELPGLAESAGLFLLAGMTARWSPVRQAVISGVAAGAVAGVWSLRFFAPASVLEGVGVAAFWSIGALIAAGIGMSLRFQEARRLRAVAESRAALRLQVARDLHDFVAHDISEMLAHAQAGQFVPTGAADALQRIEQAGQRAMAALDRTVQMLHHDEDAATATTPAPSLTDLPELAERFSASGRAQVRLTMADAVAGASREASAIAYRTVVEALTNVRRHAPGATLVEVTVTAEPEVLVVTVTDDGVPSRTGEQRDGGGFGLPALAEHLTASGGDLTAGALPGGWEVRARIPVARR